MSDTDKIEKSIIDGEKAKHIMSDFAAIGVFDRMREYLDKQELGCDPDNKEKAQRIIISRQLLAGIEREIQKIVNNGKTAKISLEQIRKSSTVREKVREFRR